MQRYLKSETQIEEWRWRWEIEKAYFEKFADWPLKCRSFSKLRFERVQQPAVATLVYSLHCVMSNLCSVGCVLCSAVVSALTLCTLCFTMIIVHCSEAGSSGQFWCTGKASNGFHAYLILFCSHDICIPLTIASYLLITSVYSWLCLLIWQPSKDQFSTILVPMERI